MSMVNLSLAQLHELTRSVLRANNTSEANAQAVARALVAAEADGQKGHGASRIPSYAAQSRSGKVDGFAAPSCTEIGPGAVRIDARCGFAYPALELAIEALRQRAPESVVALASIGNSHHSGVAAHHVAPLAKAGLIGLSFGNGPQGIAPWGGNKGLFGTNPVAFAAPRAQAPPLVIDMSLSKVARGKVNVAAQRGEFIPEGWALDAHGAPTTDPKAALAGTMLPMGDAKGAQLVLMVEILAGALSASNFGYEASSFFAGEGDPPRAGQLLLAIAPDELSAGTFAGRVGELCEAILAQPGTRLPGTSSLAARAKAEQSGVDLPQALYRELLQLGGGS
ncbi:MAG: Ldh family oxidoreductase [Gammaproteobacteria bacterium]|nr:Ldh family oxidoreductase [Gammaproteobacteria bacterium]